MSASLWENDLNAEKRKILQTNISIDAVVIGAGMAGLLTAYMLQKSGLETIVLEAHAIGSGVTKNTTAKITSQHRLIYDRLISQFGIAKAKQYAAANEEAVRKYEQIINEHKIDCEFEAKDAFVYSLDNTDNIKKEIDASVKLGINASYVDALELPFDIKGAVKFPYQAQFNPIKFLNSIAKDLKVYENTKAINIEDHTVITEKGYVKAKYIVVATHYPFMNVPGFYFLRMHQERSYVIALENCVQISGMCIDSNQTGYSFRNYRDFLLLGGAGHRTGKSLSFSSYEQLRAAAKIWYPNCVEKYHWSAQDCVSVDEVPYIGQYALTTPDVYVATGFKKWGMTSSMAAATIITDSILGRENRYAEIFNPQRFNIPASAKNFITDTAEIVKGLSSGVFEVPEEKLNEINVGCGRIIEFDGKKIGVYKDAQGTIYKVSVICPHLGCQLEWNQDELSWDCPCHGSRFDYKGRVIDGPAVKNLPDV